jgi:hypothetical protein
MGVWENNVYRGYVGSYYGNIADVDIGSITGAVHLVTGSTIDLTAKAGKIGIGTQNPEHMLHIEGSGNATIRLTPGLNTQDISGIDFERSHTFPPIQGHWRIVNKSVPGELFFQQHTTNIDMATDKFRFSTNFFVGYGEPNLGDMTARWNTVYAVNGTINTSDARDKTNIQNINYGLAEVMRLRPVSFSWKDKHHGGAKLGLIAQEVKEVVSEVVVQGNLDLINGEEEYVLPYSDKLGIFYSDLIPVLIKATQEQQQMIEDLKKEIIEMKKLLEQR